MKKDKIRIIYDFESDIVKQDIYKNFLDFDKVIEKLEISLSSKFYFKKTVSIYFVNENTIKELNNKYRKIDSTTDVLSFSYEYSEDFLGEIIICFEKIREKAKIEEEDLFTTFLYMFFHSFLHLIGYDHENEEQYIKIEKESEDLIRRYNNI